MLSTGGMRYRREVDGLRAVAIVAVLLFHLHVVDGGFIGVDVFFVISGYLITTIVRSQLDVARFHFTTFYERRLRRLFPALAVTLATTLLVAAFVLDDDLYINLASATLAAVLSMSNVQLATLDYFDPGSETKPLLHTWSLSVEEQFYAVWPLLLLALHSHVPHPFIPWLVFGIALTSLGAAQLWLDKYSTSVFFFPQFRACEFLLGALLSWFNSPLPPLLAECAAVLGGMLIVYPMLRFTNHTPFPGLNAMIPCLGTALLIRVGDMSAIVQNVLGNRIMVYIGKLSYSLYLVHWPVIVLMTLSTKNQSLDGRHKILAVVLTVVLALVLFRYVETPFRMKKRGGFGTFVAAISGLMLACGMVMWDVERRGTTIQQRPLDILEALGAMYVDERRANSSAFDVWYPKMIQREVGSDITNGSKALIIGDSHAGRLLGFGAYLGKKYDVRFYVSSYPGCSPLFGVRKVLKSVGVGQGVMTDEYLENCRQVVKGWEKVVQRGGWDVVFLVSRWSTSVEEGIYGERGPLAEMRLIEEERSTGLELNDSRRVFETALRKTVETIQQTTQVVVVSEVPDIGRGLFACKKRISEGVEGQPEECMGVSRQLAMKRVQYTNEVVQNSGAHTIIPSKYLCERTRTCRSVWKGKLLYRDSDHLSDLGALYLALRWENDKVWFPHWHFA